MSTDILSFTLRTVTTHAELMAACHLRANGYGHHVEALRAPMLQPDSTDLSPWTTVFLCEDKATGEAVGTVRVQTNTRGNVKLDIENDIRPPKWMADSGRAEMTRLVVSPTADPLVKPALWKAGYMYCMATQVRWLLISARKPGLIKQYEYLGCSDIHSDSRFVELAHVGHLPHRIFALDVAAAERNWHARNHRMLRFMVDTVHPDIELFSVKSRHPVLRIAAA